MCAGELRDLVTGRIARVLGPVLSGQARAPSNLHSALSLLRAGGGRGGGEENKKASANIYTNNTASHIPLVGDWHMG